MQAQVGMIRNTNLLEGGVSVIDHESKVSSPEISIEIPDTYGTSPINVSGNIDCVKDGNRGERKIVVPKMLPDSVGIQQYQCGYLSTEIDSNFLKAYVSESGLERTLLKSTADSSRVQSVDKITCVTERGSTTTCQEMENRDEGLPVVSVIHTDSASRTVDNIIAEAKVQDCCEEGAGKVNSGPAKGSIKPLVQTDTVQGSLDNDLSIKEICYDVEAKSLSKEKLNPRMGIQDPFPPVQLNKAKIHSTKAPLKARSTQINLPTLGPKVTSKVIDCNTANSSKQEKGKRDQKCIPVHEKLKTDQKIPNKESIANATSTDPKVNFLTALVHHIKLLVQAVPIWLV